MLSSLFTLLLLGLCGVPWVPGIGVLRRDPDGLGLGLGVMEGWSDFGVDFEVDGWHIGDRGGGLGDCSSYVNHRAISFTLPSFLFAFSVPGSNRPTKDPGDPITSDLALTPASSDPAVPVGSRIS